MKTRRSGGGWGGGGHGKEPWRRNHSPLLYSKKTGSTLTWALADIGGGSGSTPAHPLTPAFLPQIGQGSALNKQFYKSWWSLVVGRGQMWKLKRPQAEIPQQVKNRSIRPQQSFTVTVVEEKDPNTPLQSHFRSSLLMFTVGEEGKHGNGEKIGN